MISLLALLVELFVEALDLFLEHIDEDLTALFALLGLIGNGRRNVADLGAKSVVVGHVALFSRLFLLS